MPWLFERRYGIAAFDYWWGYTAAEIDLMVIDQPVISYKSEKKGMGNSAKDVKEMDDLADAWMKHNKGASATGKTISLNEFMKG